LFYDILFFQEPPLFKRTAGYKNPAVLFFSQRFNRYFENNVIVSVLWQTRLQSLSTKPKDKLLRSSDLIEFT
jgi:hypothetical protein